MGTPGASRDARSEEPRVEGLVGGAHRFLISSTTSLPHHREAKIETTLSFQNLRRPSRLRYRQAADPVAALASRLFRFFLFMRGWLRRLMPVEGATRAPIIAWTVRMEGSRIVFSALGKNDRDEIRMQSEPCLPRTILCVCPRQCGEEGAEDRDSFMRTGLDLHVYPKYCCLWPPKG